MTWSRDIQHISRSITMSVSAELEERGKQVLQDGQLLERVLLKLLNPLRRELTLPVALVGNRSPFVTLRSL